MGLVSVVVVRYQFLLYPAMAFLCFVSYRIHAMAVQAGASATTADIAGPFIRIVGLFLMYRGRQDGTSWSWAFWFGRDPCACPYEKAKNDRV